ncbi:squalene/phytoene synthase family protein [Streptomyces sp. NPDC052101]|uniref:phytoene/squalene synthase family protein n=1 Tax=Streptomyces sp. NPDC052101 TaxID=3155763 RepID=UPI00341CCEBD
MCLRDAGTRDGGRTRWWAIRSFPAQVRPYAAAVIALAFTADDHADTGPVHGRVRRLDEYVAAARAACAAGGDRDPILHATAHTMATFEELWPLLEGTFTAMRQDAAFTTFTTYEELEQWAAEMTGGPTVGLGMLAGSCEQARSAEPQLRELGALAQLVDMLCDLADDLADSRLYLPLEDLDRFGVTVEEIMARRWTPAIAELVSFEAERIQRRLPSLGTELQHAFQSPLWPAAIEYGSMLLDQVIAAGANVLRRPVKPRLADITAVWKPVWRCALSL